MSKRTGPHPISVHLGMAAANAGGIHRYVSGFSSNYDEAKLIDMMRGIKLYQSNPYVSDRPCLDECWSRGGAKLLASRENGSDAAPLIIVPSLVNRSYIFNLNARRSFVQWAAQNGTPVYLLDWGDIAQGESATIEHILFGVIAGAIEYVASVHNGAKPNLLGYCIGGALTLSAVQPISQGVGKIVLLASPWDFHHRNLELSNRIRSWSPFALSSISEKGYLPEQWMQALFASLEPDASVQKFARFADMDQSSDEAKLFVDVEDWLNDNVNISAEIAQHCLQKWFAENVFVHNKWYIGARHIDFSTVQNDVLVMCSARDRLVPMDCAIGVRDTLLNAPCEIFEASCGHIGFIAGKNAVENIWRPMHQWLQKN